MMQRPRKKFGLLKQILEEELVEPSDEHEHARETLPDAGEDHASSGVSDSTETNQTVTNSQYKQEKKKETSSVRTNAGPSGMYPVQFSTLKCRNEACQTRLSSFPMFPSPEDTVWISDDEGNFPRKHGRTTAPKVVLKKKKTKLNSGKSDKGQDPKERSKPKSQTQTTIKNEDGTRKEFGSEHLLKQSKNPAILAWLHQKNRLLKQQRRAERREKREKRFAIQEERRQELERREESDKRVKEWMKMKKHQYSTALRASTMIDKNKITPKQKKSPDNHAPPNYRVVKSFKCQSRSDNTNDKTLQNTNDNGSIRTKQNISTTTTITTRCIKSNKMHSEPERATKMSSKMKSKLVTLNSQSTLKYERELPETSQRPKTAFVRPKTASSRARDALSLNRSLKEQGSPQRMQSVSYDQWLKCKREEDKRRAVVQKRELVDSHLGKVISEIGKERVRKIKEGKKHIDTGLKNFRCMPAATQRTPNKRNAYEWIERANPRPEPQGCALPDSIDHADNRDPEKLPGLSATPQNEVDNSLDSNSHLNDKKLQPSKEKVEAILNAEKQKLIGSVAFSSKSKQYHEAPAGKTSSKSPDLANPSTKNLSKSSVRPAFAQSDKGLTPEQVRKVEHDMDVLGLLEDFDEESNTEVVQGSMSTVRDDYFDYGSEVDTPHLKSNKFVNQGKRQSLDFQII